jgi:homopolymeric O-antigen transport system permease protein
MGPGSILARMAVNTAPRAALPTLGWLPRYGELLRTLVRRELRARFKGSALGLFWSLIYPLAMMGVYTLVFSVLWKVTGNIPHYPLFVLSGLAVWGFFQAGIQLGTTSLVSNGDLITKVWFPRELVPASAVLAQTVTIFVMLAILIPTCLIVEPENARTVALVVPIVAGLICLVLGIAWLFSVANVYYRDVEHLLAVGFLPWFFLTPVLYGLDQFSAAQSHRWLILLMRYGNPVTPYVESVRAVVLQHVVPGAPLLLYVFLVGPLVGLLGLWTMQRFQDRIAIEL